MSSTAPVADSERTKAVCTLIGSNIASVHNGQVHLKETATISIGHTSSGYSAKTLSLDTLLALMLIAIWQPQIVCGLIDLIITGLFVPMSATEADVVTATLRLILLLAASPTLSLSGYQGARSRIIVFCLELLHPLPPESFLQCISSNLQVQLAMLIVLAFQASSHDCRNEMLRCTQHTQWLSRLGVELEKTGPHLELPGVLLALFCLSPLQAATAELLPSVTMPLFVLMVQPDVLGDCEVADVLLSAMRAYAGLCILDNPLLSPHGTLSKSCWTPACHKRLAERSATQLALDKLHKQQNKLQSQLDWDADALNTERQFFNLPVPARKTEGNYALESLTLSSVGPTAVMDRHAGDDVDQTTAYPEDSKEEFDERQPNNLSRDFK
ncbi:TPA: hypothetical protein ACH3X3_003195 [Trebouxia sp. C0006]